jgi:hypothetical protein
MASAVDTSLFGFSESDDDFFEQCLDELPNTPLLNNNSALELVPACTNITLFRKTFVLDSRARTISIAAYRQAQITYCMQQMHMSHFIKVFSINIILLGTFLSL